MRLFHPVNILKDHHQSTIDGEFKKQIAEAIVILSKYKKRDSLCDKCQHQYNDTCQSRNTNIFFIPHAISFCDFYIRL